MSDLRIDMQATIDELAEEIERQADRIEELEAENERLLTAMEAINRTSEDMLDPVRRRGPSAKAKAEGQAELSDPPF